MFVKDENLRYIIVNDATADFFGRSKEELLHKTDFELMDKQGAEYCELSDLKAISTNEPVISVENIGNRVFETTKFPIKFKNNKTGVGGIVSDITKRKNSETELLLSRQRLALHIQQTPLAVVEFDLSGNVLEWNPAATAIFGYEKEEAIGKKWTFIVPENNLSQMEIVWDSIIGLKSGGIRSSNENITKDNRIISCEWFNTPLINPEGVTIGVASLMMDVTDNTLAAKKLKDSEEQYRRLINTMGEGLMMVDNDDKILFLNNRINQMFGYENDELIGKRGFDIIIYEEDQEIVRQRNRTRLEGVSDRYEVRGVKKSGEIIWLSITGTPVEDASGSTIGSVGILADITEQKQMEDSLKTSEEKFRLLNATKDKFFSLIAHDLKAPLGNYRSLLDIMLEGYNNFADREKIEILTELNHSAKNIYNLLDNLLNWAGSQTGRIKFNPEQNNVDDIIKNCVSILTGVAKDKKITLATFLNAENKINIDANMINTVVRNLVSNAIKFTREKGIIYIISNDLGDSIEVSVRDTGVGMDNETIENLFKIDSIQKGTGTRGEKGTGLGLILCKEFVAKHGGTIRVESEENKGSKFTFTIPKNIS